MTIATTTVRLAHRVRLVHTATGKAIESVSARGVLPYGWALRVRGGDVVVTVRDGTPAPSAPPAITIAIRNLRLAALVQSPVVDVILDAADITVDVAPLPTPLDVELSTPTTGVPRSGRTVTARATSGPSPRSTVPLPESTPGDYGSIPIVWTAAFRPLDLLVDGELLCQLVVDPTLSSTRVRLVDTT